MSLISPGVEVKVVNETFYSPAALGTIPAIFVVSAENKMNTSGTDTAVGTLKVNAEKPILISSQRELAEMFGDPIFYTGSNSTPEHGGELNEYGLQAAYSFLGANNRVWLTRADLDLSQLEPSRTMPYGRPYSGTVWLDVANSDWGVFEWNKGSQRFNKVEPIAITDPGLIVMGDVDTNGTGGPMPKATVGAIDSYAMVFGSTIARLFYRNRHGTWVLVGSDAWKKGFPVFAGHFQDAFFSPMTASLTVNGVAVNVTFGMGSYMDDLATGINDANIPGITAGVTGSDLELFVTTEAGDTITISGDTSLLTQLGMPLNDADEYVDYGPGLQISPHTIVPSYKKHDDKPHPSKSIWIKTTPMGGGADWKAYEWNTETNLWDNISTPLYESHESAIYNLDRTHGGKAIEPESVYVQYNVADDDKQVATFKMHTRIAVKETEIFSRIIADSTVTTGTYNITLSSTAPGSPTFSSPVLVSFTTTGTSSDADVIAGAITGSGIPNVSASVTSDNRIRIVHTTGGEIQLIDDSSMPVFGSIGFSKFENSATGTRNLYYVPGTDDTTAPLSFQASNWTSTIEINFEQVSFYVPGPKPSAFPPDDGQLWYHSDVSDVDIMINTGNRWVGYKNYIGSYSKCNPTGPLVTASMPETQIDGSELVTGDIWIDTSDLENYPIIRRYNKDAHEEYGHGTSDTLNGLPLLISGWELIDITDQTTENGIIFADARSYTDGTTGIEFASISALQTSDFVDPDCPPPELYPRGMMLWNTRRSGFNVKRYEKYHIDTNSVNHFVNNGEDMINYATGRWVTASPNNIDGSGSFGRYAQRTTIVSALKGMLTSNEPIRETESRHFNLMATPGYPELISDMVTLNYDRKISSFIIGDTPARLKASSNTLHSWLTNEKMAHMDNDVGVVTHNEYVGMYYPWGYSSDNNGNDIAVPPSHMLLRTIAESDSVSYPWFAPAGTRRGTITNASSVGHLTNENEFKPVALTDGQRDTLYENNVNPISYMEGVGLIAHGQKTRAGQAGALDRINVARLVIHLRRKLELVTRPFIYQPNDKLTRNELSNVVSGILLELMGLRAINDFLVVCDESNNTPTRITRNEIWVDVAVEPIYTAEFIYVPLRLQSPT